MPGETGKLFAFNNVGLFSDHFLNKRLAAEPSLWVSEKSRAEECLKAISNQYKRFTSTYKSPNEAQTEDDFIRPVLALLGYYYIVQTTLKHKGKTNQPDYALFADDKVKKEAGSFRVREQEAFYSKTLAICDAKYWGRALDIKLTDKKDTYQRQSKFSNRQLPCGRQRRLGNSHERKALAPLLPKSVFPFIDLLRSRFGRSGRQRECREVSLLLFIFSQRGVPQGCPEQDFFGTRPRGFK
jgi:hypothetical protein